MVTTIYIKNNAGDCNLTIQENITTSSCTNYILRLNPNINYIGPFDVTVITGLDYQEYTGVTYNDLRNGLELPINCP
jgi:hypothetical protein